MIHGSSIDWGGKPMPDKLSDGKVQAWIDNRFGIPNTVNTQAYRDFADYCYKEMLGQLRAVVDKLTVIDGDYACRVFVNNNSSTRDSALKVANKQLQDIKRQLLDLMGE